METRTGHLFDLGPDGLGFIAEPTGQIWAFVQKRLDHTIADDEQSFFALNGKEVRFSVVDRQVRHLDVRAAIPSVSAFAASR